MASSAALFLRHHSAAVDPTAGAHEHQSREVLTALTLGIETCRLSLVGDRPDRDALAQALDRMHRDLRRLYRLQAIEVNHGSAP